MLEDDSRFLNYNGNEETTDHRIETSSTQTKVARKNDVTVGFCSYEKHPDVLGGCIYLIAVDKNYRQQGYATKMMQTAIDDFRNKGVQVIEICVHRENQSALNLYQKKFDFKLDGKDDAKFLILSRRVKNKNWCCW